MVGMVGAVADSPAVVGHQDGAVHNVAHKVIQGPVVAEALVAAAQRHMHTPQSPCSHLPVVLNWLHADSNALTTLCKRLGDFLHASAKLLH